MGSEAIYEAIGSRQAALPTDKCPTCEREPIARRGVKGKPNLVCGNGHNWPESDNPSPYVYPKVYMAKSASPYSHLIGSLLILDGVPASQAYKRYDE